MDINVTMASGDTDEWQEVADAIDDKGSLIVLAHLLEDEVSENVKTMELSRQLPQEPATEKHRYTHPSTPPPYPELLPIKVTTFRVVAQYAPGMWIKVEYL